MSGLPAEVASDGIAPQLHTAWGCHPSPPRRVAHLGPFVGARRRRNRSGTAFPSCGGREGGGKSYRCTCNWTGPRVVLEERLSCVDRETVCVAGVHLAEAKWALTGFTHNGQTRTKLVVKSDSMPFANLRNLSEQRLHLNQFLPMA